MEWTHQQRSNVHFVFFFKEKFCTLTISVLTVNINSPRHYELEDVNWLLWLDCFTIWRSHTVTLQTSTTHKQTAFEKAKGADVWGSNGKQIRVSHGLSLHSTGERAWKTKCNLYLLLFLETRHLSACCRKAEGSRRAVCYEMRSEGWASITLAPVRAEFAISLDKNR